jgi:predicted O-linked N-acetylglucosamine transferase (SPINDLY family)
MLKASQLADTELASQTVARFASRGIAANRVILEGPSPRGAYLNAYSRIDIVLDTFPYPGGTTSLEALWMGVPILTRKGNRFLSRLGESIACNAGQLDWIAADRDDYAKKAIAFAADLTLLVSTRATLRDRVLRTPLFDAQRFARHFGEALLGMYREKIGR